jgi:hypothetical protein
MSETVNDLIGRMISGMPASASAPHPEPRHVATDEPLSALIGRMLGPPQASSGSASPQPAGPAAKPPEPKPAEPKPAEKSSPLDWLLNPVPKPST